MIPGNLYLKSVKKRAEPKDGVRIYVTRMKPKDMNGLWWSELSPSWELLRYIKDSQKNNGGIILEEVWKNYYDRFINEMSNNMLGKLAMLFIRDWLHAGQNVTLICFCPNENYCHRSILIELILSNKSISLEDGSILV